MIIALTFIFSWSLNAQTVKCNDQIYMKDMQLAKITDYAKAIAECEACLQEDPDNLNAMINVSLLQYVDKKHTEAMESINKVIDKYPASKYGWYIRAIIESEIGKYVSALADFEKTIELSPTYKPAISGRCSMLAEMKRSDEAKACRKKLKKMD